MGFLLLCLILSIFRFIEGTNYPGNLTCTALNSTVLQVTWDQATDANVAGYHLDVERVDGLRIEFGLPSIDLNHISYETYTFYGLGKFGTYNITVHAYFTSGANGTDYVVSCQTSSDVPDASNFNLSCAGISTSEISCTWNALSAVYWNGIPQGYEIRYIGFVNDYYTAINLSTSDLSYIINRLGFDTWYIIQLRTISDAGYSPYTSDHAKTHGWPDTTENKTRYYCYETIPGRVTWEWEEMPCTVYVGIILAFMLLSLIFMVLSCLLCCCKEKGDTKNNVAVNIFNEEGYDDERDLYDDDDDDDDDDDFEESHRAYSDDDDDDFDYDSEGNPTDAAKAAKKKRKLAEAHGEAGLDETEEDVSDEDSVSDEEPEYETSEVETEPDEEYESSEGDEELDEEERIAKKEKKLAAIAAAKEMREKRREEKAKRKAENDAEKAEKKAKKDRERAERKAKKDQERAERNAKREEEKAKRKAEREEKVKEVAMQKAERKEGARHKAEQNQKNRSDMKSKNVEENERKDNEEESEYETSEYDSEDYDSVEDSDSGDTGKEGKAKEQQLKSKTKTNLKMKNNRKKTFEGKAVLSTINENRRYKKKTNSNEKQSDAKYKNKSEKKVKSKNDNNTENIKDKQNEKKIQSDKKNTRKFGSDESYDDSDVEYYEDWDPDAENNPETIFTVVNTNDQNLKSENSKALANRSKSSRSKSKGKDKGNKFDKNKNDAESRLASRNKRANAKESDKNKTGVSLSQDEDSEDSDGYDSDDEDFDSDDSTYSSEESNGENLKSKGNQNTKNRVSCQSDKRKAYNLSDDSGRGSVMSCDWGDSNNKRMMRSNFQSNKKETKTGFFRSLFGKSTKTSVVKRNPVEKNSDSVFKPNDETNKTSMTNDWDSDDDGNTGDNSWHSKQNKSTNWQGNSVINLNNDRNINNNGYPSDKLFNASNSMSNSQIASSNTKTDFGDWGSDDNDNENEHSQQYRRNSHSYGLEHTDKSTVKNVGASGLNSSYDFTQGNGDYKAWPHNHSGLNNNDNKLTNRIAQAQAASLQVHKSGVYDSSGIYVNSNSQVPAQYENGNFVAAYQYEQFLNNNYASNLDGQFGQAGATTDLKGQNRTDNNKQLPTVYLDPSHNGQTYAAYSAMDKNGESWPLNNDEFGNNLIENIHYNTTSGKFPQGEQFYTSNGINIQNSQLGSHSTHVQQNGQYRSGKGSYPENSQYNTTAKGSIPKNGHNNITANEGISKNGHYNITANGGFPKNGHYNITANGGIPENGHYNLTASDTILPNGQAILGNTAANQNRNLSTTSRNPAFGANNRSKAQNTRLSPMKDLSVHKKSFAVSENRTKSPTNTHNGFNNGSSGTHNSSGTANESNDSGQWPKATDNQNKSRKLVSFRTNPAFSFGDAGKNPGIVSAKSRHQGPNHGTNGVGSGPAGNQAFIMPDADILLPDTETSKRSLSPVGKFIVNKPAWGNTKSNTPNSERTKGSKTPVEDLLKRHKRMSLTEPEPVLATDRLAKKFPFLSTDELNKAKMKEDKKGNEHESSMRKNKSDSSLPTFFGKGNLFQNSRDEDRKGSTENNKDTSKIPAAAKSDGEKLNPETRDKVFYGFGVGKWRWAAAKWLNMWKMKRRPVKTGMSSWD